MDIHARKLDSMQLLLLGSGTRSYYESLFINSFHMQEYLVEDLHGSYTAPKLEPEHEERLKMLKLM
jgi:hypothetical protein